MAKLQWIHDTSQAQVLLNESSHADSQFSLLFLAVESMSICTHVPYWYFCSTGFAYVVLLTFRSSEVSFDGFQQKRACAAVTGPLQLPNPITVLVIQ